MKIAGKILLIVSGILFIVGAVYTASGTISYILSSAKDGTILSNTTIISLIVSLVVAVLEFFAGLGGIFRAIGKGPFRGWVPPFAIILFVLFMVDLVGCIMSNTSIGWVLYTSTAVDVAYFLGFLFTRKR